LLALLVIVTLLIISLIINKYSKKAPDYLYDSECYHFSLDNNGKCIFYNYQEFQLDVSSRVGWFGCWLVLTPSLKNKKDDSVQYLFLIKDSVSSQNYSRISRVIKKLKYLAKYSHKKQCYN